MTAEIQTSSFFKNSSGENLSYKRWRTENEPKGIILVVHGLNSHSGYYQNFAAQLYEHDYGVYALDLVGRGQSEGERYYIADYNGIVKDIDQLLNIARSDNPTAPIFLLGHSAGGVFASVYARAHQSKLKGLISESFAFQVPASAFAQAIIKFLSLIIPHTRLVKLSNKDFSRDMSVVALMDHDTLLENEKQPTKTMQQLFFAAEYLKLEMPNIKLPILILHGTADKATKPSGSQYFLDHASSADKQLKLYEGHYHDLLNDKYHGIVVKDIVRWLNERV